jgi:hypothetical protein
MMSQTFRIVGTQAMNTSTQYMNESLREETKLDDQVMRGKISREEADEEYDAWKAVSRRSFDLDGTFCMQGWIWRLLTHR